MPKNTRTTPCRECKRRRRKCVYEPKSSVCDRCAKLGHECIFGAEFESSSDDEQLGAEDGNKELQQWIDQVMAMQTELQQLQDLAHRLKSTTMHTHHLLEDSTSASNENNYDPHVRWSLTVVNGELQLETRIQTIHELFMYMQSSKRYLSPFSGVFNEKPIYFQSKMSGIIPNAVKSMSRTLMRSKKQAVVLRNDIEGRALRLVDRFVNLYFEHHNDRRPLVHEPSYRAYYSTLKDPLKCPVTMAICVCAVVNLRRDCDLSAPEKRSLGDFYYSKCRDILLDIYDDPKRKIETVVSINLVMHYLSAMSLQLQEARHWASVAYLICESTTEQHLASFSPISRVIFERNSAITIVLNQLFDIVVNNYRTLECPKYYPFEALPDESETLCQYLEMCNCMATLYFSTYLQKIILQIRAITLGDATEISLEDILRFQEIVLEWWTSVPSHLRICDNPFSANPAMVYACFSERNLVLFSFVQSLTVTLHSCLLTPLLFNHKDAGLTQIIMVMSERAYDMTAYSSEMLLAVVKQMTKIDDAEPHLFMHTLESLSNLIGAGRKRPTDKARAMFFECLSEFEARLPDDHRFISDTSPIASFQKSKEIENISSYIAHPLPGIAFVHDILKHTARRVQLENSTVQNTVFTPI